MNLGDVIVRIGADVSSFVQGMSTVSSKLDALGGQGGNAAKHLGENMKGMGDRITDAGLAITKVLTPIAGSLTAMGMLSLKNAMDFESSFATVKKAVEASDTELKGFEQDFRNLAKEIPLSVNEINKLGAEGAQLGVANEALTSFVKTVAEMATTTNLSAEQAGEAFARIANIMGLSQKDFERMGSTVFDLGRKSAATESEITSMAMRIAGAGKTVGMSTDQVLSFAAGLASVGIRAEMGGSAISRLMMFMAKAVDGGRQSLAQFAEATGYTGKKLEQEFAKSNKTLADFANTAGMKAEEFATAFKEKPAAAIAAWLKGVQQIQQSGGPIFEVLDTVGVKSVQMRDAVLRAASAGDLMTKTLETGSSAWEKNTALAEGAAQRYGTMKSQLTVFDNKLNDLKISMGQAFIPMLQAGLAAATPFIDMIASGAKWFQTLDPGVQKAVAGITVFASVLGPAVVALGAIVTVLTPLAPLFAALTGPIGLAVAGITAGATAGLLLVKNWDTIKAKSLEIWTGVKEAVVKSVSDMVAGVEQWMVNRLNVIWAKVKAPIEEVKSYFFGLYDAVVGHSYVPDMVEGVGEHMNKLPAMMTNPARAATRSTAKEFFDMANISSQAMQELSSAAIFTWGSIRSSFVNALVDMTSGHTTFNKFVQQAEKTLLASIFNVSIEMGVQWALRSLMQKKDATDQTLTQQATEDAKTAITATGEGARLLIVEATNKAMLAGVIATLGAIAAVGDAALGVMEAVTTVVAMVFEAIGAALMASVVGAEMAPEFFAAGAEVELGGTAAVLAGTGIIQGAIGSAVVVAGTALTPMATGGIVTQPTPALVGEAGPEAIIPLNRLSGFGGPTEQHITIELDGQALTKTVLKNTPRQVRMRGMTR